MPSLQSMQSFLHREFIVKRHCGSACSWMRPCSARAVPLAAGHGAIGRPRTMREKGLVTASSSDTQHKGKTRIKQTNHITKQKQPN